MTRVMRVMRGAYIASRVTLVVDRRTAGSVALFDDEVLHNLHTTHTTRNRREA